MNIQVTTIALLLISTSAATAQLPVPIRIPVPTPPKPAINRQTATPTPPPPPPTEPGEPEEEPAEPGEEPAEPAEPGEEPAEPDETPTVTKPLGSEENPLNPINAGELLRSQINADLWQEMRGELPCIEPNQTCIESLQATATSKNALLVELDTKIEEINEKIEEAKSTNKKSIQLSVFEPALQYFLSNSTTTATTTATTTGNNQQQSGGFLNNIFGIFTRPVGTINGFLSAIGLPLFRSLTGGNDQQKAAAIAISDLSVKVAELQRGRAELANKIKEQVAIAIIDLDLKKREFQASLTATKLKEQQTRLIQVQFSTGSHDAIAMLQQESSLNSSQLQAFREWGQLKAALVRLKLLVIGSAGEE